MAEDRPGAVGFAAGLSAGSQVAGYRLEEQIGRGAMAVVFRALDERPGRQVALKVLVRGLAADEYALACSAFALLSGAPPFAREEGMAVLYAQVSEPPPALTDRRHRLGLDHAEALASGAGRPAAASPEAWRSDQAIERHQQTLGRSAGHAGIRAPRHPGHPVQDRRGDGGAR